MIESIPERVEDIMKRVIKASRAIKASVADTQDREVLELVGRYGYDTMYKKSCSIIDDVICNEYGDVDVRWTNGGAEVTSRDGDEYNYGILYRVFAEFENEYGRTKYCYGEASFDYDRDTNPSRIQPELDYFTDEIPYQ